MLTLGLATWATSLLIAAFILISVVMILFVLIQRPQGGGLSGAFGSGAGSGQTAFGTKTGDVLTGSTVTVFVIWLLFAIGLNFATRPQEAPPSQGTAQGVETPGTDNGGASPDSQNDASADDPSPDAPTTPGDQTDANPQGEPPSETPSGDGDPAGDEPGADAPDAPGTSDQPTPNPPPDQATGSDGGGR